MEQAMMGAWGEVLLPFYKAGRGWEIKKLPF